MFQRVTHRAPRVRRLSVRLGAMEGLFQYLRLASRNTRGKPKGDTVLELNKPRRGSELEKIHGEA